ncbi:MAG: DMT family transporter [Rhodothermia bacterium]|nr:DMT family transporter [Rhodothermia bacterium]
MARSTRGTTFMFLAAVFFSVMTVFVKLLDTRLPASEVVFVRSVISLVITSYMLRRAGVAALGNRRGLLLLRGLLGFAALVCFFYAIPRMPLADVTVIQYTNPVFVAILAAIFLGEGIRRREVVSVALSLVGVVAIARPAFISRISSVELDMLTAGIALGGAVLAAGAYTLVRKLRETEDHLVVILYFPLVSVPAAIPLMWNDMVWPTLDEWFLLAGIGITTQIAQIFLTKGLHIERAARATAVSYIQIVFATLWGIIFFQEIPDLVTVAGALFVVVGIAFVSRRTRSA